MAEGENQNDPIDLEALQSEIEKLTRRLRVVEARTTLTIEKIRPLSLAKILSTLYAFFGILFVMFSFIDTLLGGRGFINAFGAIMLPVFAGVMGFALGIVVAWLYNLTASAIGGLEIDI